MEPEIVEGIPMWITTLISVGAIFLAAVGTTWLLRRFIRRFVNKQTANGDRVVDGTQRAQTIAGVLSTVATVLLWTIALLLAVSRTGINISPILATIGAAGVALGIGGQHFVRDLIEGIAIVLEDQYRVGDVVEIQGISGRVERVSLRSTAVRDVHGTVHNFSNGDVRHSANLTKGYSRYVIDLPLPYDADIDRATQIARDQLEKMRSEERYVNVVRGSLNVLGVDAFEGSGVIVKMYVETNPGRQWEVGRELLRRIKQALDEQGISIAAG